MDPNKPALKPPPGIISNFDDPPNGNLKAHFGIAISVFLVLTGASLRAYSRLFCMKQVKLEDYVALAALGPYIAFIYGVYSLMNITGFYVHQWNVRAKDVPSALYIIYTNTSLFQATIGSVKTAVLLEWTRIFVPPGTRNGFYWTCQIVMWVNILYYIAVVTVSGISCFPHEKIWNMNLPGKCFNTKAFFITNAVLNLTSDIIILALPQKIIWGLKMSKQKKIGVSLVFAVGVVACLVGAARLTRAVIYYLSNDNLYNISAVFVWCTTELSVAFLVFCLPAIPKIFTGDNWIKQFAASWHLRSSSMKNRSKGLFESEQQKEISTWNSFTFIRGVSVDAEAGRAYDGAPGLKAYPPPVRGSSAWRQELQPTEVTKNDRIVRTTNFGNTKCCVEDDRPGDPYSPHHPSTSWYDEH
ncbi:hypothetical protein HD806DRAFT_514695 [Xylariaceae sp. AK1471]|nr:hypothetical protein HD806DRAFT_514695 [Xylariaceae sp. AK1471]